MQSIACRYRFSSAALAASAIVLLVPLCSFLLFLLISYGFCALTSRAYLRRLETAGSTSLSVSGFWAPSNHWSTSDSLPAALLSVTLPTIVVSLLLVISLCGAIHLLPPLPSPAHPGSATLSRWHHSHFPTRLFLLWSSCRLVSTPVTLSRRRRLPC